MVKIDFETFYKTISSMFDKDRISKEDEILTSYSLDRSFVDSKKPVLILWPNNADEVQKIIQLANKTLVPLLPISSIQKQRENGDTIPKKDNTVIVDLSKMNKIIRIDRKNRVCMVEPGVTFAQLLPELEKNDLKPLIPLHPRNDKSVVASLLERTPIMQTKNHWDQMDPMLCVEVIFGTGDIFRTGSAAGPGTLEEQWEVGQAQKNPLGPTQASLVRTIQGAQGCMGIVTWSSIKCELLPTKQKPLFFKDDKVDGLISLLQEYILKYRLGDETFIVNNIAFSSLLNDNPKDITKFSRILGNKWIMIAVLSGRGECEDDKIQYMFGDIEEYIKNYDFKIESELPGLNNSDFMSMLKTTCAESWSTRLKGGCQKIFFITTLTKVASYESLVSDYLSKNYPKLSEVGIYIQPLVHGCNCHLEFQLYYDSTNSDETNMAKDAFSALSKLLVSKGAFFSRPYGEWASEIYNNISDMGIELFHRVKRIFDPNNIMNPGVLCFSDEFNFKEETQ